MTPGERPSYWELLPKSDEFADLNSENVNNPDELKTKTAVPIYGNTITAGYMEEDWYPAYHPISQTNCVRNSGSTSTA